MPTFVPCASPPPDRTRSSLCSTLPALETLSLALLQRERRLGKLVASTARVLLLLLSRKLKKNALQKQARSAGSHRRADAARRMGCCESSNRRKIDETLNPIMGTVRIAVAACAMQAVASTSDRFRRLQAAQDQLTPLMSEAAFKGDVATMDRLVVSQSAVRGLVLCQSGGRCVRARGA